MIINEGGKVFSDVVPFDQKQIKKIQKRDFIKAHGIRIHDKSLFNSPDDT